MRLPYRPPALLLAAILALSMPAHAQKTDVITFKNGDQLTVDIKELERGLLRATTVGLGTIYIEWRVIESVQTDKIYQVELGDGRRLLGTIQRAESGEGITVLTPFGDRKLEFADIVTIQRVKRDRPFWERIDGSIQAGMNFNSGSKIGGANFGLNMYLLEEKYLIGSDVTWNQTTGSATAETERFNWGVDYYRLLENRWFWTVNSDLDSNQQLGIDLRLLAGAGAGRFLIKSNSSRWLASAGLAVSRELRIENNQNQVEGQLISDYSMYFFTPTKTDLNVRLVLYPSLTESDRLRGNFDIKLRWEIIKDLTWNLTYNYTWDNQPPMGANESESTIASSIGYTF